MLSAINPVRRVRSYHRFISRHNHHLQLINLAKFFGVGIGSSRHPRQFFIHSEIILESDRRQSPAFLLDPNAFFGFDRLVQAAGITPTEHQTSGKFINNNDFSVFNDVIAVPLE